MTAQRRWILAAAVATVLALFGGLLVAGGLRGGQAVPAPAQTVGTAPTSATGAPSPSRTPGPAGTSAPGTSAEQSTETPDSPAATPTPAPTPSGPAVLAESAPTRISIPAIGVDSSAFVELGLNELGEVAAPEAADDIGWFTGAHAPGAPGVGVVAAHVTWDGAEAPFFELGQLQQGDEVEVEREDGSRAVFAVTRLATFAKDDFPTEEVYRSTDEPELVLVTCGGEFDADARYYDSNVIVWAEVVDTVPA